MAGTTTKLTLDYSDRDYELILYSLKTNETDTARTFNYSITGAFSASKPIVLPPQNPPSQQTVTDSGFTYQNRPAILGCVFPAPNVFSLCPGVLLKPLSVGGLYMLLPPPKVQEGTLSRLETHSKKYVGKKGVKEIRARFKGNHLFLQVVKEAKGGLIGRMLGMGELRGVGRLARLEYLGPNKWKFLIYKPDTEKYGLYPQLHQGTIEDCLDAAARVYLL